MPASVIGHAAVVKLLLAAGADKDATDKVRLYRNASSFGPLTLLDTSVTRAKSSSLRNFSQNSNTALMSASARGHTDIAKLFLDAGADKDARDDVSGSLVFTCLQVRFSLLTYHTEEHAL